jgi:hypothetical protein
MRQIVKKTLCVLVLIFCTFSAVYAANSKNITLIIQGTGQPAFVQGFKEALIIEAKAAGYDITDTPSMAKYAIRFSVEFDQEAQRSKFTVSLVKVVDQYVIVSMEYMFADEEEMLLYSQLVFFMLMANLPDNEVPSSAPLDDGWRNKWVYISPYFDYSIMFLALKKDGLDNGKTFNDDYSIVNILDNKVATMPGVGLGVEFQFLNFMSIEPGALISSEQVLKERAMWNIALSAKLKFPLKFIGNVVLEPYGACAYTMRFPQKPTVEPFAIYPQLVFGGGLQVSFKAGKSGGVFFDVSYMYYGDTGLKNPYAKTSSGDEYTPNPKVIHYNQTILGLGVGYKFGFGNRKR